MLSEQTIRIIKSTVPVLETAGVEITKRFYQMMFTSHPELLNIFNHANQKQGRQQTALANAVYAAAVHIDQLPAILPVVKQIAHKHRSLGVKPEHYPIVGEHLLKAIKDVLGEAATPEILQAWKEAYGVIAGVFIQVEEEMYSEAEHQPGGWEGFRAFRVQLKEKESEVITSFYLVPVDGGPVADFQPGQYVSIKLEIPGEAYTHIRQYSLSDAPHNPYYRISVKREDGADSRPAGKVSAYLHEQVKEGDTVWLSAPAGDFVLDEQDTRPVVLISGGVGLTPMVSMLNTLVQRTPERPVTFIHAAVNGTVHALKQQVLETAGKHPQVSAYFCYEQPGEEDRAAQAYHKEGYIDQQWLQTVVPDAAKAVFYFCGPLAFMSVVNHSLRKMGVAESDIHYEFFGPAGSLESR
ncbi:NO-inducible flavohemoprotein [Paenibacillus sambharensis]|uniref:Flavohemoprotein n=1 Tax=Paenibacillus sambharensis TaxID=1803190 RepID=A0A2W1M0X5_9BACL|nr:NO-inducible flavohemoprotein [Paenibacillus sambharensis]PZD97581.1 NO-inducible flavohemoprotein [Paenibacillus sambharensis]